MLSHSTLIYISNRISHLEPTIKQLTPASDNLALKVTPTQSLTNSGPKAKTNERKEQTTVPSADLVHLTSERSQ
jgi:hypothetical protein